jgi:hypothetical protein
MYGVEAQASGGGGLAARTPYQVSTMGADLGIHPTSAALVGGPGNGVLLPYALGSGEAVALPVIGAGGRAVDRPPSPMSSWREVMDWHSSPALWVLILILALYAWLHVSIKASVSGGRHR